MPLWCPLLGCRTDPDDDYRPGAAVQSLSARNGRVKGVPRHSRAYPPCCCWKWISCPPMRKRNWRASWRCPVSSCTPSPPAQEPLLDLAEQGRFRADLAHALSTLVIEMPPLVGAAARHSAVVPVFGRTVQCRRVAASSADSRPKRSTCCPDTPGRRTSMSWPTSWHLACQAADGPLVDARHLPDKIRWAQQAVAHPRRDEQPIVLDQFLEEIEKELIARAMKRAKGNKTKAAKLLGVTRARFHRRLEHFGLSR